MIISTLHAKLIGKVYFDQSSYKRSRVKVDQFAKTTPCLPFRDRNFRKKKERKKTKTTSIKSSSTWDTFEHTKSIACFTTFASRKFGWLTPPTILNTRDDWSSM